MTYSALSSVVSFFINRRMRYPSDFDILRERGRPSRCRRAAVVYVRHRIDLELRPRLCRQAPPACRQRPGNLRRLLDKFGLVTRQFNRAGKAESPVPVLHECPQSAIRSQHRLDRGCRRWCRSISDSQHRNASLASTWRDRSPSGSYRRRRRRQSPRASDSERCPGLPVSACRSPNESPVPVKARRRHRRFRHRASA